MQLSHTKKGEYMYWKHLVSRCSHVCACRQALLAQVLSRKAKEEVLLSFLETGKGAEKPKRVQFEVYTVGIQTCAVQSVTHVVNVLDLCT